MNDNSVAKPNADDLTALALGRQEEEMRAMALAMPENRNADPTEEVMAKAWDLWGTLKDAKPDDRSDLDRRYAIAITDFEKFMAYFKTWVIDWREN